MIRGRDGVPSAEIYASVTGRVVDAVAEEIRIGASADETSAQICSPPAAQVSQQQTSRMLGTPDQGLAGLEQRIEGERLLQNLRRSVGVGAVERQFCQRPSVKLQLRAMCRCLIDVDVLSAESAGGGQAAPVRKLKSILSRNKPLK